MDHRERFIALYKEHVKREGSEKLLDYLLNQSDFLTAPASTRFHGAYAGGLLEHSLNVYDCLCDYLKRDRAKELYHMNYDDESVAIVALLHDVCKVNCYKESTRNQKINGTWQQVPYYEFDDQLPYGHGEKSVYIINGFIRLSREEAFAIRYHMGF
ncbi:MAG: hydrolase, partial [Longicatena sp.]